MCAERSSLVRQIRADGLQERIYSALRENIVTGNVAPGARLRELDLAAQFGTSQTPVREALRRLAQEGLVISYPRRGSYVAKLSVSEIEDVYSLRGELESWAVRRFVARAKASDFEQLRRHLDGMRQAAAANNPRAFVKADVRFHQKICTGSGSELLTQLWTFVDGRVRGMMLVANALVEPGLSYVAELHEPLLKAIEMRDAETAVALVHDHMHHVWDEIKDKIVEMTLSPS
jgi:DNA-binding GntR family transcriptional regulator